MPKKNILVTLGDLDDKFEFYESARKLNEMGFKLYATTNTFNLFKENGIKATQVYKISEKRPPNILTYLEQKKFDLVINTPSAKQKFSEQDGFIIRRKAIDYNIPLINNIKIANIFVNAIYRYPLDKLEIKSMEEYV
jgi:carbamoyl-phosphate synthase large subunit